MRTRVLWLVKGLGPGGAERLLVEHARAGDRDHFEYEVAYLLPWKNHLVAELDDLGVRSHCLGVRSVSDLRWVARLQRLVRHGDFEVVHVHSPALAALARPALRVRRRRPALVYTEHNRWPSHHQLTRFGNRLTIGLDDATIAVSDDVRRSMGRRGRSVVVVRHGIDSAGVRRRAGERAAARAELGIAEDELLAVIVANLRANKGYSTLLDAARRVADAGVPVRFVAAGQGPQEAELRARARFLGIDDSFRFLGYFPDVARLLAGADMFVLASHHEGLPLAVMEALALGLPVVATDVGGVPELVEDGISGLLVAPRDDAALAAAVVALTDPTTRATLASGAMERGASVDGLSAVQSLDDLYCRLLVGGAASRR